MDKWLLTFKRHIVPTAGDKSSHFMEFRINSSSLRGSSNTPISKETRPLAQFPFRHLYLGRGEVRQFCCRLHAQKIIYSALSLFLSLSCACERARAHPPPPTSTASASVKCNQTLAIVTNAAQLPAGKLSSRPHVVRAQGSLLVHSPLGAGWGAAQVGSREGLPRVECTL